LAISAVVFSCLGGIEIGRGIDGVIVARLQFSWIVPFLMGSAFLGYGIFQAVMLVRRISPAEAAHPISHA
jgi:hypothetical protein